MRMRWKPFNDDAFQVPEQLSYCLGQYFVHDDPPHLIEWNGSDMAFIKGLMAAQVHGASEFLTILGKYKKIELILD